MAKGWVIPEGIATYQVHGEMQETENGRKAETEMENGNIWCLKLATITILCDMMIVKNKASCYLGQKVLVL